MFWTIMTLYLQGSSSPSSTATSSSQQANFNYALAERMIAKQAADNRLQDQEQLLLYLMILEAQGKYDEAVKVLSGDLKVLCPVASEYSRLMAGLYRKGGNWKGLKDVSLESLKRK